MSYLGTYYLSAEELKSDVSCSHPLTNTNVVKLIHFKKLQGIWKVLCKWVEKKKSGKNLGELQTLSLYKGENLPG